MLATDTADSPKSPPAKPPTAKLSFVELSPTKLFPTMDLIPVSNAQVAWLSMFGEGNAGWRELGYKTHYDYLRTIDSSGRVREMVKQHSTALKNKDHVTKILGNNRQQYHELLKILNEGDSSEKWLKETALAIRTDKDPKLAKQCLN
ncbi:hypothetical protein K440DRAFT_644710 [Wilcoxina mikolae CBS 423.85]|nr:hypothetical protein K440DRAFT_644710 [Wilcoxina mikolae CBS 423.85]